MRSRLTRLVPAVATLVIVAAGPAVSARAAGAPRWRITSVLRHCRPGDNLSAVAASGPRDVWALGQPNAGGRTCWADVEHWNGTRWRRVAVPPGLSLSPSFGPQPLAASSASNAWIFPARTGHIGLSFYSYNEALRWNGRSWRASRFPAQLLVSSAVTFGPAEAWAFGEVYGRENVLAPYAARWDGRAWHRARPPGDVLAVSALSRTDMWAAGPTLATAARPLARQHLIAMHWTGWAWHVLALPAPAAPAGRAYLAAAQLTVIGPRDVWWCSQASTAKAAGPAALTHWNGTSWQPVPVPAEIIRIDAMSQDGHGGLWLLAGVSNGPPLSLGQYWYHYHAGQWTRQLVPSPRESSLFLFSMNWVPGTRKAWAVGEADYNHASVAVITRYRP